MMLSPDSAGRRRSPQHFIGASAHLGTRGTARIGTGSCDDVFPEALCTAILVLPIAPPVLGQTDGTRDSYNRCAAFFTPALRANFPVCAALADALQRPDVARPMAETCEIDVAGSFLRMEYMQDLDGAWLEPHRDIPEKLFSMVVYLFTGPDAKDWGTDIYDADKRWVARSLGGVQFGAVIFVAGPGHLARLRAPPDRRRAPADGDQLRPAPTGATATNSPSRNTRSEFADCTSLPPSARPRREADRRAQPEQLELRGSTHGPAATCAFHRWCGRNGSFPHQRWRERDWPSTKGGRVALLWQRIHRNGGARQVHTATLRRFHGSLQIAQILRCRFLVVGPWPVEQRLR